MPLSLQVPSGVELVDRVPVYATITVSPRSKPREVSLPVNVVAPPGFFEQYEVAIVPPLVPITVHGPTNLLNVLDPEKSLRAFVDLTSDIEPDKPKLMAVKVIGPLWLMPEGGQTRITVSLRQEEEQVPVVDDEEVVEQPASEEAETTSEDALPIPQQDAIPVENSMCLGLVPRLFVPRIMLFLC